MFLIESIGFSHTSLDTSNKATENSDEDNICLLDRALARSCRYLCLMMNDDRKTLQVIKPYLISFLDGNVDETTLLHRMKARAAISFLSCWSILDTNLDGGCCFCLHGDMEDSTFRAVCNLFLAWPNAFRDENCQLISPIMTLFRLHPTFYSSALLECGDRIVKNSGKNDNVSKIIIDNLLFLVGSNSLLETFRLKEVSEAIKNVAYAADKATSNGPLHMITGTLVIQVQSILGFDRGNK